MKRVQITIDDLAEVHDLAQVALMEARYDDARVLSSELTDKLQLCDVRPVLTGDGRPRPYSIVVVAHQCAPEHLDLLEQLTKLDSARFEVILIENADSAIFDYKDQAAPPNFTLLRLNRNLGIGVARGIGFQIATGVGVICIDDDGVTTPEAIESLVATFEQYRATAVRGRVLPRTPGSEVPNHYDLGNRILRRYCDIEGMAIWNRRDVLHVGGFDPILYGHEGAELTARLYPLHGPEAFLYDPNAVLWHDYGSSPAKVEAKRARHSRLEGYLTTRNPNYHKVLGVFRKAGLDLASDALLEMRRNYAVASKISVHDSRPSVSIIATCWNGEEFIPDFVGSLDRQTDRDFELVFVDDGSDDDSLAALKRIWPRTIPLRVIQAGKVGRAAALNRAIREASGEICLIADIDDLSLPHRVEWTREAYRRHPEADMIGFMIFDINSHSRAARPFPVGPVPLEVRCLFGMPCPFPAFSFRRERIRSEFNVDLEAGLDCDWLFRSILKDGARGVLVPLNLTYYHTHEKQITASKRNLQRSVSLEHVQQYHQAVQTSNEVDDIALGMFTGWQPIRTGPEYWRVHKYAVDLLRAVAAFDCIDVQEARNEISRHLDLLHLNLAKADYAKIKATAEKRSTEISVLRAQLEELKRVNRDELRKLQERISQAEREISVANAKAEEHQRRLSLTLSSRSWQLTAPLRSFGRWNKARTGLKTSLQELTQRS